MLEMRDLVTKKNYIDEKKIANKLSKHYPKHFIPRYNMVSFTSLPYLEVYKRAQIQKEIISKLNRKKINMSIVEKIIYEELEEIK